MPTLLSFSAIAYLEEFHEPCISHVAYTVLWFLMLSGLGKAPLFVCLCCVLALVDLSARHVSPQRWALSEVHGITAHKTIVFYIFPIIGCGLVEHTHTQIIHRNGCSPVGGSIPKLWCM